MYGKIEIFVISDLDTSFFFLFKYDGSIEQEKLYTLRNFDIPSRLLHEEIRTNDV
jgi:hypothetical protein